MGAELDKRVRLGDISKQLSEATRFFIRRTFVGGWLDVAKLVTRTPPTELVKHANELQYLKGELIKIKDADITEQALR